MIIVELKGGFGNQLFQYAAGMSLAAYYNVPVKVDVNKLLYNTNKNDTKYKFELVNIKAGAEVATAAEIGNRASPSFFTKITDRLKPAHRRQVYKEPHFEFDENFFKAGNAAYLSGYWQSERYFENSKELVKELFQIKEEHVAAVQDFKNSLTGRQAVALHVRRKDYLKPGVFEFHGVMDEAYYSAAIKKIYEQVEDPYFVVFSDDAEWVKQHYKFTSGVLFIDSSISNSPITDFYLISSCKHQVIANSTFSWWAAYLNTNPGKTVIAPKRWFNKAPHNTKDLVPPGWIRL